MVKTLPSNEGGVYSIPDWGNKVLHAAGKWKCQSLSCVRFHNPMDCSLPGSSVHGILQARTLEWVAIPFSKGSSQPRGQTRVCRIAGRFFTVLSHRGSPGGHAIWHGPKKVQLGSASAVRGRCSLHHFHFSQQSVLIIPHRHQHWILPVFLMLATPVGVKWYHIVVLIRITLVTEDVGHLSTCLLLFAHLRW